MSSSRLDGETTPTTVRRSSAERGRSPSEGDRKHPRRDGHRPECAAYGLITPHGDRKPFRELLRACRSGFITPHGDRKHLGRTHDRVRHLVLITPHGDRKPACSTLAMIDSPNSLPPMGIGNVARMVISIIRRIAHYPSWGSETPDVVWWPSISSCGSLPLMGIGNPRNPLTFPREYVLITPHGDRKRATA